MRLLWKVFVPLMCIALICGAGFYWQAHKKAAERKLVEDAQACRVRAERGDTTSQYDLALMYHQGKGTAKDYSEALHWYRLAAAQGNAKAQYGLGYMYDTGEGVGQDFAEALHWYHKSADQGDAQAECAIASIYYDGRGVPTDRAEAARWYRQAADRGLAKAQYDLGYMYYYGQGVSQDRAEADRWFHKAADQGEENAQQTLGLRRAKWTGIRFIIVMLQLIGGAALSISLLLPRNGVRGFRQKVIALTGILCLFSAGLGILATTRFWALQSKATLIAFAFGKWLLDGILLVLLAYILLSVKKAKSYGQASDPSNKHE